MLFAGLLSIIVLALVGIAANLYTRVNDNTSSVTLVKDLQAQIQATQARIERVEQFTKNVAHEKESQGDLMGTATPVENVTDLSKQLSELRTNVLTNTPRE